MKIAILLYEGFTSLDAVGPFEVLRRLPHADIRFVAARPGVVPADSPALGMVAGPLDDMPQPDIVLVPGGSYTWRHMSDDAMLSWLSRADTASTWTTSVCTGSLLLGAAGLLRGKRATSHFYELESLHSFGATPVSERVVVDGKLVTAAGVSAGIDMALHLCDRIAGTEYTRAVQLAMEYDPDPPHDCGSVQKAPPELVDFVRQVMRAGYGPVWTERNPEPS